MDVAAPSETRRKWLSYLLGTSLGATCVSFLYPVLRYLVPPATSEPSLSEVELDVRAADIAPNSGRIVPFAGKPVLLFRTAAGELRALSATCSHLACTVQFRQDRSDIWCACHNGVYDTNGTNISGPPPRPLTRLDVAVRGEKVVIRRA
ncbi:MAG TPA: ubiquinol-cytochrome c reductase iron-sulfur subunit [Thermoanaerobaculia bacterium]|nr:ubiquinol-cytochrome c reductase iron-sulfur subunit [Thermoanaerobaculia bacterium]